MATAAVTKRKRFSKTDTRFPNFLGGPGSAEVHPDLVHGAHVRLRPENLGVGAADVADGAVHVVESELGNSVENVGQICFFLALMMFTKLLENFLILVEVP